MHGACYLVTNLLYVGVLDQIGSNPAIASHAGKFMGIRNGIDIDIWDPENDELLPKPYNADTVVRAHGVMRVLACHGSQLDSAFAFRCMSVHGAGHPRRWRARRLRERRCATGWGSQAGVTSRWSEWSPASPPRKVALSTAASLNRIGSVCKEA